MMGIPDVTMEAAAAVDSKPSAETVKVSIVVVNFNGVDYIGPCLESIVATLDDSTELIVVDNGSTDGSTRLVESNFPEIELVQGETNVGFGEGNNIGARLSSGEYLIFINPDTEVRAGWWQALVQPLRDDSQVGCTTSRILLVKDPNRLNTAGNDIHLSGLTLCRGMGQPADLYDNSTPVSAISGAAFAVRRDLFWEVGGFDGDFFLYMEETDLSWRIQLRGYQCVYVPESIVAHDYELRFGPHKTYYQERNRYRMLLKSLRWRTLFLLLPALLLAEFVTWGYVFIGDRANWRGKLSAYATLWREWSEVSMLRRRIAAERVVLDRDLMALTTPRLDFQQTGAGAAVTWADRLFNPLFALWHRVMMGVLRW